MDIGNVADGGHGLTLQTVRMFGKNGSNLNRLKEDTKPLINIGENDVIRIEGAPEGVAQVKKLLLEMVHKMENEICKDLIIEQRFHRNIIDVKGEKTREVRDKLNQVNITLPESGLKSDKVTIRGPKSDADAYNKYLHRMNEKIKLANSSVEVPIWK
ncbi:vigilin [Nephila pilipes]|uniref:Vigilin n=2 Tax=Nephila pilipes TaxID=299642 RepID=A0A8X6TU41_NEPPI|nr:vigilin [Nephila pilipes]GFT77925.1 vigilin [Nephila pilipes]